MHLTVVQVWGIIFDIFVNVLGYVVNGDLDLIIWLLRYGDRVAQYDDHFKCGNEI